jgi:hypothetical protein
MALRNDLPFFQIILLDFDHGRTHTTLLSKDWNLEVGNIVEWESGSTHHGYATVISVNESTLPDLVSVELRERK